MPERGRRTEAVRLPESSAKAYAAPLGCMAQGEKRKKANAETTAGARRVRVARMFSRGFRHKTEPTQHSTA
jgi:hypothetical protein